MVCSIAVPSACCFLEMFTQLSSFDLRATFSQKDTSSLSVSADHKLTTLLAFIVFFFSHLKTHFCLSWNIPRNSLMNHVFWFLYPRLIPCHVYKFVSYIQVTLKFSILFFISSRLIFRVFSFFIYFYYHNWKLVFLQKNFFYATKNVFCHFASVTAYTRKLFCATKASHNSLAKWLTPSSEWRSSKLAKLQLTVPHGLLGQSWWSHRKVYECQITMLYTRN